MIRTSALLLSAACCVVAATASAQTTEEAVAQARFSKGRELFMAQKYAAALQEFRAASQLYESPNTRLYMARCERGLGHLAAAYVEYQRAASEASDRARTDPRYVGTRDHAREEGQALEPKLAHLKVLAPALPEGAKVAVNGSVLATAALGVAAPIDPGSVTVTAEAQGYARYTKSARAAAGETVEIKVDLTPLPAGPPPQGVARTGTPAPATTTEQPTTVPSAPDHSGDKKVGGGVRVAGFVVGTAGLVGIGLFAGFAAAAQTRYDQLRGACGGRCDPSLASKIDGGETYQNVANVALGLGAAALVTGAIMIAAGGPKYVTGGSGRLVPLVEVDRSGRGAWFGVRRAF